MKALESDEAKKLFLKTLKLVLIGMLCLRTSGVYFIMITLDHELEKISDTPDDDLIQLAIDLFKINVGNGVPESLAKQQIMNSVPFNLFPLINDYLK